MGGTEVAFVANLCKAIEPFLLFLLFDNSSISINKSKPARKKGIHSSKTRQDLKFWLNEPRDMNQLFMFLYCALAPISKSVGIECYNPHLAT